MGEVKAPDIPRPKPTERWRAMRGERRDEIQTEITRLLGRMDRLAVKQFPLISITAVAHDVAAYADKTMIDKAVGWLREYGEEILREKGVVDLTIEFRKAMEG